MVKPFRPYEFAARVRAQLRLFEVSDHTQFRVGDQMFHLGNRTLSEPGQSRPMRLTVKESAVLRYLHRANGEVVSRAELLRHVWAYSDGAETHTVATHHYRLRRKVEPRGDSPHVLVHGPGGYRLLRTLLRTGTPETTASPAAWRDGPLDLAAFAGFASAGARSFAPSSKFAWHPHDALDRRRPPVKQESRDQFNPLLRGRP